MQVVTVEGLLRLLEIMQGVKDEPSVTIITEKISELFTSRNFVNLDYAADLLSGTQHLPAIVRRAMGPERFELASKHRFDLKAAEAILIFVRAGRRNGISRRNLQRRFHRIAPDAFREILGLLSGDLRLRIERKGRRILIMLGEAELMNEFLLCLAEIYEKDKPNQGISPPDLAVKLGFTPEMGERVAAELKAEGSTENVFGVPSVIHLTATGYQKYLPLIRALRVTRPERRNYEKAN